MQNLTHIKVLKDEIALMAFSSTVILLFDNPTIISINYLITLFFGGRILLRRKKVNPFSFHFILFFLFNLYILVPSINFLLFEKAVFLPSNSTGPYLDEGFEHLSKYIKYSSIIVLFFILTPRIHDKKPTRQGLRISFFYALMFFLAGILVLAIQFYSSGAYSVVGNHGLVRQYLFSQPPIFSYFVSLGTYFCFKEIGLKKVSAIMSLVTVLLLFGYCAFWMKIGIRGSGFYPLMICVLAFFRTRQLSEYKKFFKKKYLVYLFAIYLGFMYFSIKNKVYHKDGTKNLNPTLEEIIDLIKKRPDFLNPGTLEYGSSYYNFSVMMQHDFDQDYLLQPYIESLKTLGRPILKYFVNYDTGLFYRYRNEFFKEREKKLGKSGGTGFSLQYEFYMQGILLMLIISFLLVYFFQKVSVNVETKGGVWEIYAVLLFTILITFPRSSLTINFFITRFFYAIVIYYFLKTIRIRNSVSQ